MGVIRRTRSSLGDYRDIWDYIARENPIAADGVLHDLDATLQMLSDHPHAGPRRPELRPRVRSFPVGSYLIFYRPVRGGIELLRVLHGARDVRQVWKRGG